MTSRRAQRGYWDKLYESDEYAYGTTPNDYLLKQAFRMKRGMKALAVGDGEGRNGVWLATQGLKVVSLDWSPPAREKAQKLAWQHNVTPRLECCDLLKWTWPAAQFDLVIAIYLHLVEPERRFVHKNIVACLKPDGLLVLEAFHRRHGALISGGLGTEDSFYTADLLRQDFCNLKFVELLEETVPLAEGYMHQGSTPVVRLVARKPL